MPGEWPFDLETAFLSAVNAAMPNVFKSRLDHEPREFTGLELPCLTLFALEAPDVDHQTGPATQVTWTWSVRLYASLGEGYEAGQRELKTIWPRVLQAIRSNPSLGVTAGQPWARLRDPGGEPELNEQEEWIRKTLQLQVRREETS